MALLLKGANLKLTEIVPLFTQNDWCHENSGCGYEWSHIITLSISDWTEIVTSVFVKEINQMAGN